MNFLTHATSDSLMKPDSPRRWVLRPAVWRWGGAPRILSQRDPIRPPSARRNTGGRPEGTWGAALLFCALAAATALVPPSVRAEPAHKRLDGWSPKELEILAPHLAHGPVALVEFADTRVDALPGVHVATYVDANAAEVAAGIGKPAGYPAFMRTLDRVEVLGQHGSTQSYAWRWQLGLFTLQGRNLMTTYEPAPGQESRGYRFGVESTEGDFGNGRMLFRVLPVDAKRSLLTLSMRVDLRDANYITRQLSRAARSINRSANLSLGLSMLLSFKARAEATNAPEAAQSAPRDIQRPDLALATLAPLLSRGDLLLLSTHEAQLDQVAVVGQVGHAPEKVREVMLDAKSFGAALLPGSRAEVTERHAGTTKFDWGIRLPLVGVSGSMQMQTREDEIHIDAVSGAFEGGRWRFITPAHAATTVVVGWSQFDPTRSAWLLQRLVNTEPYLRHGVAASTQLMLLRALRGRLRKLP